MTLAAAGITRVQLCGPLVVERGDERLETRLPGRQGRMLFGYLAINRHRRAARDELVAAVWPNDPPPAADGALNALLSKMRRALGADAVDGRSSLRLRLDGASVDVEAATEAIHRAESSVALADWRRAWGPSLVALFVAEREFLLDEDAEWIDVERRRLAELRLRALECYGTAGLGIGGTELVAAVRAGRRLVELAPLRESGYRCLMQALAAQGNSAEALRVYSGLCDTLRDELGVSPSADTRSVYEQLVAT
ncbi:MAG TPA: BTAD domain-containing putative transcriptional regulator [Acidimicrobiia bacterium]|nr:BTAD domain-containing putative transcriptional regulator [Acidimicrobiia bacterium]